MPVTTGVTTTAITNIVPASGSAKSGTPEYLKVISARMYANTCMTVIAILSDAYGNVYNFDGVVSAYIWQNTDIATFGKGDLLQKWENVPVPLSGHFEQDIGKYLVFNFHDFAPRQVQSVWMDVTLVTGGKTLSYSNIMPLTMGADCPCQTQDLPPGEG
jgi:hypothetical protein